MIFVGFNTASDGAMEEHVENYVLQNEVNNDRDILEDEGWGFNDTLGFKMFNEEIFNDVDEDGIQTNILSSNANIKKFIDLSLEHGSVFFDENFNEINKENFIKLVNNSSKFSISICDYCADN